MKKFFLLFVTLGLLALSTGCGGSGKDEPAPTIYPDSYLIVANKDYSSIDGVYIKNAGTPDWSVNLLDSSYISRNQYYLGYHTASMNIDIDVVVGSDHNTFMNKTITTNQALIILKENSVLTTSLVNASDAVAQGFDLTTSRQNSAGNDEMAVSEKDYPANNEPAISDKEDSQDNDAIINSVELRYIGE